MRRRVQHTEKEGGVVKGDVLCIVPCDGGKEKQDEPNGTVQPWPYDPQRPDLKRQQLHLKEAAAWPKGAAGWDALMLGGASPGIIG